MTLKSVCSVFKQGTTCFVKKITISVKQVKKKSGNEISIFCDGHSSVFNFEKLQMFIDTRYQDTKQICVSISYVTDISPSNLSTLRFSFKLLS